MLYVPVKLASDDVIQHSPCVANFKTAGLDTTHCSRAYYLYTLLFSQLGGGAGYYGGRMGGVWGGG